MSNSGSFEPSATLKRYPATGRPPLGILLREGNLPRQDSRRRFMLLPPTLEGSRLSLFLSLVCSQRTDVKAGEGLMSPSAVVHCDAREDRESRAALCITPVAARARARSLAYATRGCESSVSSGKVILMTPSLVARRDTCMLVARQEARLDKHARSPRLLAPSRKPRRYICMNGRARGVSVRVGSG